MTALSTRDALAEGICSVICEGDRPAPYPGAKDPRNLVGACYKHQRAADALIASGVVVDVATLADDDALVDDLESRPQWFGGTRDALEALAAALAERAR